MKRYLLDTNTILYFLADRFSEPFPKGLFYASVITEMELLSYPNLTTKSRHGIQKMLSELTLIELEEEIRKKAIEIRRAHLLKLPDSIIAASAYDKQLLKLIHPKGLQLKLK